MKIRPILSFENWIILFNIGAIKYWWRNIISRQSLKHFHKNYTPEQAIEIINKIYELDR